MDRSVKDCSSSAHAAICAGSCSRMVARCGQALSGRADARGEGSATLVRGGAGGAETWPQGASAGGQSWRHCRRGGGGSAVSSTSGATDGFGHRPVCRPTHRRVFRSALRALPRPGRRTRPRPGHRTDAGVSGCSGHTSGQATWRARQLRACCGCRPGRDPVAEVGAVGCTCTGTGVSPGTGGGTGPETGADTDRAAGTGAGTGGVTDPGTTEGTAAGTGCRTAGVVRVTTCRECGRSRTSVPHTPSARRVGSVDQLYSSEGSAGADLEPDSSPGPSAGP